MLSEKSRMREAETMLTVRPGSHVHLLITVLGLAGEYPCLLYTSRGIDLSHFNYIIMDGLYYSFLYIKADVYPSRVRAGWMSALINAGEGVDIDVHLRRENRSRTIDKVAQRLSLIHI